MMELEARVAQFIDAGDDAKLLLNAGQISAGKNVTLLLSMMEVLANDGKFDYWLLVAGADPLSGWFEAEAEVKSPGRVHLLRHVVDSDRLADISAKCDAMIHPNPREPFGIAPPEAMALGLPLVVPISGGVLSYADEHSAWLVEPRGEFFAESVRRIFRNELETQSKVARTMETAREFSWGRTTARFFNLYDRVVKRFRAAAPVETHSSNVA
jgi:glycosyltransferase involved in cell wall biosynthesis